MVNGKQDMCFPNTYKEILDLRPRYPSVSSNVNTDDSCCDYFCCLMCSPIVIPMWLVYCFGVTGKKICFCKKNDEENL